VKANLLEYFDCATLVIINAEPTPYDSAADAVLRQPIGELLPFLVAGLR